MRAAAGLEHLWQDVRYAIRLLRRSPGFTVVALSTLTLAVAANTAIFSVIEAVMLQPLPFNDSERLVSIVRLIPNARGIGGNIAVVNFVEWRLELQSFEALSMLGGGEVSLTGAGEPESVPVARVSANVFSLLRIDMQRGRPFSQEEEDRRMQVAIISDELWVRRFGADPDIVGHSIDVAGTSYTVVGVLPRSFRFMSINQLQSFSRASRRPEIWIPIVPAPFELDPRSPVQNYAAIGRLRPGVTVQQATGELNLLQQQLAKLTLTGQVTQVMAIPLREFVARNHRAGLTLMWASGGTVLLISCVNVANLLLARGARRRREIAARMALGASRGRIIRQLMTESIVLSGMSGALGCLASIWLLRAIVAYAPADVPRIDEVSLDVRVLLFMLSVTIATGVVFGMLPAWRESNTDPQDAIRLDPRTAARHPGAARLQIMLVSAEVATCAAGLIVGALLLQSFARVLSVNRGFDVDDIRTARITLDPARYSMPKRAEFLGDALEKINAIAGVASAGVTTTLPLADGTGPVLNVTTSTPSGNSPSVALSAVDAGYFRTLGIPVRAGRLFGEDDRQRPVAVVSNMTAQRLWPDASPIGKQFRIGPPTTSLFAVAFEVVGVVGDAHAESLTSDVSERVYVPYWQQLSFTNSWSIAVKSRDAHVASSARVVLRDLGPDLAIPAFRTMADIVAGSLEQRRFQLSVVLLFAAVGLVLAAVGIYGMVAYSVAQRTSEIGIRMALGATAGAIRALVAGQALLPLVPGLIVGVVAALAAGRLTRSLLFGVGSRDPATFVAVAVLLAIVALIASYLPARRATRVNPAIALRCE
jgi:putative ABC transport system permease protein